MESRLLLLLLTSAIAVALSGCGRHRVLEIADADQPPVVEPALERRQIDPAHIDTEDFEVGVYAGQLSVEDFGVNTVVGARFAYHITESLFVEAAGAQSDTEPTSYERLSGAAQLLTDSERKYSYYNVSLGYNLLPGESFIGRNRAFNTSLYLIGGVGNTKFAGDDRFTMNFGMGVRLLPLDWLAVHADVRDHVFDLDVLGREKTTHNLEAHVGVTFFF
jgi:outer membrane beta-barrel protein